MRCPNCFGKVPRKAPACPSCGEAIPAGLHRRKPVPKAYRKINQPGRWSIGVPIGLILLVSAILACTRMFYAISVKSESDERLERVTSTLFPGQIKYGVVDFREFGGYQLSVHPHEASCLAAIVRIGAAGEEVRREHVLPLLRGVSVYVKQGETRDLMAPAEPGRYAWAVWHDADKPVAVVTRFEKLERN